MPYQYGAGTPLPDLATPGARIGARVIDWLIQVVILVPIFLLWFAGTASTSGNETAALTFGLGGSLLISAVALVLPAVYEIAFTAVRGQTPGKMLLKIRVVRAADGAIPGWGPATLRWIPNLVQLICSLLSLGLWIWALVNLFNQPLRQTPFDLAAKTVVVNA